MHGGRWLLPLLGSSFSDEKLRLTTSLFLVLILWLPMGACIDTAHCFAAGYRIHIPDGLRATVKHLDATVGIGRVRVIHANDSKTAYNSHADRHEHIGKGQIGAEAFGRIVRHPKLRLIPFICETPFDRPGDDRMNLRMMRKLAGVEASGQHR